MNIWRIPSDKQKPKNYIQMKTSFKVLAAAATVILVTIACTQTQIETKKTNPTMPEINTSDRTKYDTATFGAGCFWCVEAQFQMLNGVISVASGYSGGAVKNPSYKEVCNGTTGHAEVCQIVFDPSIITYDEMLAAFWQTHDPTQLNRQGNDIGTQYRSVIYYHNDAQKQLAEKYKADLNKEGAYDKPVVTEISAFSVFYKAEDYHQNYFNENGEQPYCQFVVQPKVEKFKKVFKNKLKK
jgi:peptide-methionine (S)-S-oxide reductase